MTATPSNPIKIFYSYHPNDQKLREQLDMHLGLLKKQGKITTWYDGLIQPGMEYDSVRNDRLKTADLIFLLISPDFINSDEHWNKEMQQAMERHERGEARVIPIILRPVHWEDAPFGKLKSLPPKHVEAITKWNNIDDAFSSVAKDISTVVETLLAEKAEKPEKEPEAAPNSPENNVELITPPSSSRKIPKTRLFQIIISLLLIVILIIVSVTLIIVHNTNIHSFAIANASATTRANTHATATAYAQATASVINANPDPYFPGKGTLVLYDPLSTSNYFPSRSDSSWGGVCEFSKGSYHASQSKPNKAYICSSSATSTPNFGNFAFEVHMTIIKGDCGGIIFREDQTTGKSYIFDVCQNGTYALNLYRSFSGSDATSLTSGSSSAIHKGLNNFNLIAVVADGNVLILYVNDQEIDSVRNSTYSFGQIGFIAVDFSNPTEVVYSYAKFWILNPTQPTPTPVRG